MASVANIRRRCRPSQSLRTPCSGPGNGGAPTGAVTDV